MRSPATCPHACHTPCVAPCILGAPCHGRLALRWTLLLRTCAPPVRHVPVCADHAPTCQCPCRTRTEHAWLAARGVPARAGARVQHAVRA